MRLAINPDNHSLIGVDIGRKIIRCVMLSLIGEVLWKEQFSYGTEDAPADVLARVADCVQKGLGLPEAAARTCLGIGVSVHGALDVLNGIMRFAPGMPSWKNAPILQMLQSRLAPRVYIEHSRNCLAMAERWFGKASGADDVLCVTVGGGVSMGILIEGEVFRGSQQFAGEFGHTTLDPNGPPCGCGDNGCIEAFCSAPAVLEYIRSVPDQQSPALVEIFATRNPTMMELATVARAGDAAAIAAFERVGAYLGIGLANLVDLFNPDLIVLAGSLMVAREFFMPRLDRALQKHAWKHSNRQILDFAIGRKCRQHGGVRNGPAVHLQPGCVDGSGADSGLITNPISLCSVAICDSVVARLKSRAAAVFCLLIQSRLSSSG